MQLSTHPIAIEALAPQPVILPESEAQFPWFAVRTRSNFEKIASVALENKGMKPYCPTYRDRRRWSNRGFRYAAVPWICVLPVQPVAPASGIDDDWNYFHRRLRQ